MKYIKAFEKDNKKGYFYKIVSDFYLICDINQCAESERTFDIYFFDLAKNKRLQQILFNFFCKKTEILIDFLAGLNDEKRGEKLLTNPKLRILVEDPDMFLNVLEVFYPEDIRVVTRKYNI